MEALSDCKSSKPKIYGAEEKIEEEDDTQILQRLQKLEIYHHLVASRYKLLQSLHLLIYPVSPSLREYNKHHFLGCWPYTESTNLWKNLQKQVKVQTLSDRLWTSAARDLFVDVDPRTCLFASADSNSTSFGNKKEIGH